ncbi:MAG: DUF58 domain-containing protein [Alphaproteobacteria bacterium]|nr:DUF58 domain-containing protein [Alphaproteobacteria bacterium]
MATLHQQALRDAARLPPLLIEAVRVAQSLEQGVHGRRRVGMGESFWQYRYYEGGDSIALIDWKQSARSEQLFVRQREWEAAQTVYVWIDRSGSMQYRSRPDLPTKCERAHLLLLAMAHLLLQGGEFITWLDKEPVHGRGQTGFDKIALRILPLQSDAAELPPNIPIAANAHMLICSDFLSDARIWRDRLRAYASRQIKGILLQVTDPEEENPSFKGRVRLSGMEGETPLLLPQAESVRAAYLHNLELHRQRIRLMAENIGWHALSHVTDQQPTGTLLQLYNLMTLGERSV